MKKIFLTSSVSLLFLLNSFYLTGQTEGVFSYTIEQNNSKIQTSGNVAKLKKEPFKIIITMSEPMGILINASFKPESYTLALKGASLSEIPGYTSTGMAEGINNPDKDMMICDDAPSYWFYDDDESNRFDLTYEQDEQIVCERQIKKFFIVENQSDLKLADVTSDLYLVFLTTYWNSDFSQQFEIQRDLLKIEWVE